MCMNGGISSAKLLTMSPVVQMMSGCCWLMVCTALLRNVVSCPQFPRCWSVMCAIRSPSNC